MFPMAQGPPVGPPRPEAEAELLKESIGLPRAEVAPGRKTLLGWPLLRIMRRRRMDWAPFYWAPQQPIVQMKMGLSC
jgi:hypothetical protein